MPSQRNPLASIKLALVSALLALSMGALNGAFAQTTTVGTITGTVRDQNGAVVPKAEVTLEEERTGYSRTVKTNEDGIYTAQSLPVGRYTITTSPQGFKKTVQSGVELHIAENLAINLTLEVGAVTDTVNVTADAVRVETTTGDVSSLIGEKQVTELPLNGRNYAALVTMIPGASPAGGGAFAARGTGLDSHVDLSVNGNQSNANLWTVDGVNNMDVGSNATLLVFPSIDAIQEFRVERNSFSAEFGQAQGAVINLITKGGSNTFHGTAFWFLRNDVLNAHDFFLNESRQDKGTLRYNNFGFNVSGPIVKNKAFFFWGEEWRRERRGITMPAQHVPTAAEKLGDFSGALTGPLPHRPGAGECTTPGPNPSDPNCFPGNRIPANQLSPAGLAILKVYPDPNNGLAGNNWVAAPTQPVNTRQDNIRGDWSITSNMNLMVRWINEYWIHDKASGQFWGDTPFPTLSSDWDQPSQSFAIKLSNTLSSTTVNEFQFSRAGNDIFIKTTPETEALNQEIASKFPTVFPKPDGVGLPTFWGAGGYPALWHEAPWNNHEDLFIWKDDFSKVWGAHDLKFGALFSHNIKDEQRIGANEFAQFCGTDSRTGNALADLLVRDLPLGCYTEADHFEFALGRWRDWEFYANDKWKIRPNLTITAGLRWSRYSPAFSNNDRISNYIPRLFDGTNPLSGLVQAGTEGFNRSLVEPSNTGFQPRIGVAWDIFGDGRTAFRLGFGRFIGRSNVIEDILRMAGNPPWTTTVSSAWGGSTANLADDPTFRSLDSINPGLANAVAGVGANTAFNAVSENFRQPESWQWHMSLSREIMKNTVAEVSYIGNHGLHLWRRGINFNDVVPSARPAIADVLRFGGDTAPIIAANRRFEGLGPITMSESTGDSNYHAMQVWVNRRFSDRLAFQAAYTWSHAISNIPLQSFVNATTDPFNYDLDRGDADLDRRQMFVFNAVYELPSVKKWGAVADYVLGGWQLNTIASFLGGPPIEIDGGVNTAGLAANSPGGMRPDVKLGVPLYLDNGNKTRIINPAAFALPGVGKFGNLGRGVLRQPSSKIVDFSVVKRFRFKERYEVEFRTEMFNVFNTVNFNAFNNQLAFNGTAATLPPPPFGPGGSWRGDPCDGSRPKVPGTGTDPVANPIRFSDCGVATNAGSFGTATATRGPREIQFGFKFRF